jgi:sigma-B regulation protein RsbQ
MQSRTDVAVPDSVGAYMADAIRGAEKDVLPTAGHLPHLSSPLLVNASLLKHIDNTPKTRHTEGPKGRRTPHSHKILSRCLASPAS